VEALSNALAKPWRFLFQHGATQQTPGFLFHRNAVLRGTPFQGRL
jgi:hypothetical protein